MSEQLVDELNMKEWILNPCLEFVDVLKHDIKNNNGYCIDILEHNKTTKCPKRCRKNPQLCSCGMYIQKEVGDSY